MRPRRTDHGTVILHWMLVGASGVALFSGLRIATEAADRMWINLFDVVLPSTSAWMPHMQAAVVLVAVSIGYATRVRRRGRSISEEGKHPSYVQNNSCRASADPDANRRPPSAA